MNNQWHVLEAVHRIVPIPVYDGPSAQTRTCACHCKFTGLEPQTPLLLNGMTLVKLWGSFLSARQEVFVCILKYDKKGMLYPLP